ncbi:MAG: hypothetical protein ACD_24C00509G0001 [uncultured bacterium]|nr:MAG: hypothetical protein ACD_24C00509G0001 [uncultured bacterium]
MSILNDLKIIFIMYSGVSGAKNIIIRIGFFLHINYMKHSTTST